MNLWGRIFQERRAIILPLAILIVGNLAVLALWVWPLERSVAAASDSVEQSRHDLAMAQLSLKGAREQKTSKELAEQQLKKFYEDVLPGGFKQAQDLTDFGVQRAAAESGVIKKNAQNDYEPSKDSHLVHVTSRVVLDGEYKSIRRFLYALETSRPFVVIEKVELSQSAGTQATGSQGTGNSIEVTLELSTYYFAPGGLTTPAATSSAGGSR